MQQVHLQWEDLHCYMVVLVHGWQVANNQVIDNNKKEEEALLEVESS